MSSVTGSHELFGMKIRLIDDDEKSAHHRILSAASSSLIYE
jgi:hypothetical protein